MTEQNSGFYKDKFFYIIILLVIGSFGWTTFVGVSSAQAIGASKKEYIERDEAMMKSVGEKFEGIASTLSELKTDIKYIKQEVKK
jgi:hypothetical protein